MEFNKKKKIVDQQIEMEKKRKQVQKVKNNNNVNINGAVGFRSGGTEEGLMFGEIESNFDFNKER